ncbi:glutamine--fructose-6-phosphate transaminase (isomerizing) [Candidatus Micrarchaeota archaeon CG08_land_8_20_14_0_20_59_11]|nr:MAG: glutamine--fructose-6-phosphate transaminase (isomerizing) [Candidatus Micrarchaeota archaeon CG08_land_8_20_14_0_20_59_11]
MRFMCGIIGYIGVKSAGPILLDGLRKLEYRGYDSVGMATFEGSGITLKKDAGRIDDVAKRERLGDMQGNAGIGHTRWATHGGVTKENAHPHASCDGQIVVVHNGIIENYSELRAALAERGHFFRSQTDTEVVPHLLEEELRRGNGIEQAVRNVVKQLHGSFALLVLCSREPDKIVAARRESPLIIGLSDHGTFAASDATPFLGQTKHVAYLNDNEMAVLTRGGAAYFDFNGNPVRKEVAEITWKAEQATKGGHDYFMIKEILEEPSAMRNALLQDRKAFTEFAHEIASAKKAMVIACGTARHSAIIGKHLLDRVAGKQVEVMIASEFAYFADNLTPDTLVVCVSQSGETADVLDGVRKAKAKGCRVLSIVNVVGSTLSRLSDRAVYLNCGPEVCVAATKSFINQVTVFYLLAYAMRGAFDEGVTELTKVSELLLKAFELNDARAKAIAERFVKNGNAYYIGRGVNFAMALEGALKMKEISYVHAEGMPAGELKHGTLALIENGTPVFLLNPTDYTYYDTLSNGLETKARGAVLIGVGNKNNTAYDEFIELPEVPEIFYPLLEAVPLQLVAYYAAVARGRDPDRPRNLAKSVTVK